MTDVIFILVIISYFILAYFITHGIRNLTKPFYWWIRFIILSFFYALFFGFGAVGGGGEPGFALPAPVIFAAWYADSKRIFNNAIAPFFFWWGLILIIMISIYLFKKFLAEQKEVIN